MLNYNQLGLMSENEMTDAIDFAVVSDEEMMDVTFPWVTVVKVVLKLGSAAAAAL